MPRMNRQREVAEDEGRARVIKAALRAYPAELLPVDFEKLDLKGLVGAAKANAFGDFLASFVVVELAEGLDGEDWERAAELIERARQDLDGVLGGLHAAAVRRP